MKHSAHLDLAHKYWKEHLRPGDIAIDATCGNGHDAAILAEILRQGKLFCYDIQKEAILKTKKRLGEILSERVSFFQKCHSDLSDILEPVRLIVYNLGYLPLSDKKMTTQTASTLLSVEKGLSLLQPEGAISIMCYPGHEEGRREEEALILWLQRLPSSSFRICYHEWINRALSPTLLWIQKM